MLDQYYADTINGEDFQAVLSSYPDEVPEKLAELEQQRLVTVPEALAKREPAHLSKAEVQTLVDWKLAHGTFRPSLRKLVASNSEEAIKETTEAAYQLYGKDNDDWAQALATLAKLRGIGPATASLLLNVYDSDKIPFFSDELFRWVKFENAKGGGWDRKMKYSMGEYKEMFHLVKSFRERLGRETAGGASTVSALDAEMVAYVLGRRDGQEINVGIKRSADVDETMAKEARSSDAKRTSADPDASSTSKRRRLRSSA